jgi:hypothetical protein
MGVMVLTDSTTMKAKAFKSGSNPSTMTSASFVKNSIGNIYYVATNGSDSNPGSISQPFRSIRKGVSVLGAGDTVYIRSGTYQENLDANRDKIPSGTSWSNPVTIAAYSGETVTLAFASPTSGALINMATSDLNPNLQYIIFDRLIFDGTNVINGNSTMAVGFSDGKRPPAHHIRFTNFEVKNTSAARLDLMVGAGVQVAGSFNEFINCKSHSNGSKPGYAPPEAPYGFYVGGTDHLIERCEIYNNAGYGIHVYSSGGDSHRHTLRYNHVHDNSLSKTETTAGIIVTSGSGHRVYNNILRRNLGGIQVGSSCVSCEIYNNNILLNRYWGIQIDPGATNNIIKNNIAYQNPDANIIDYSGRNSISNNLITDPKFVDGAAGNFHLQSSSPAIDAGVDLSNQGVITDYDGIPRPQGVKYDIGSFEYSW